MLINSAPNRLVYRTEDRYDWHDAERGGPAGLAAWKYLTEKYKPCPSFPDQCTLYSPGGSYKCFLTSGHSGPHAGVNSGANPIIIWGDDLWDDITVIRLLGV